MENIEKTIKPENVTERRIIADPEFVIGVTYGKPRPGHPEGAVIHHIKEVLANVDKLDSPDRENLRLIAILHDSFKHQVDRSQPRVGKNHHGYLARKFAEKYVSDTDVLTVIEKHDDAFHAWQSGDRHGDWNKAKYRADNLIRGLMIEGIEDLYMDFFKCDNETGNKTQECYGWFKDMMI